MAQTAWPHPGPACRSIRGQPGHGLRLESGDGNITLESLLRILRALGILDNLTKAARPYESDLGRMRSEEELPQRVRPARLTRSAEADRPVEVHVQIVGHDFFAGTLWPHRRRGSSRRRSGTPPPTSRRRGYPLDPSLPLVSGPLQTALGQKIFGAFSDCAPDSWGRNLVGRPWATARSPRSTTCSVPGMICARARCGSRTPRPGRSSPRTGAVPHLPDLPRLIEPRGPGRAGHCDRGRARGAGRGRGVAGGVAAEGARRRPRRGDRDREVPERRGRVGRRGLGGGRARAGATGRTGRRRQHPPIGRGPLGPDRRPLRSRRRESGRLSQRGVTTRDRRGGAVLLPRPGGGDRRAVRPGDGRPAGAVAADRVLDSGQQHRRPPAEPRLPSTLERRLEPLPRLRHQPRSLAGDETAADLDRREFL